MIMVGDGGAERVRIDPQPDSRSSSSGISIVMSGDVYGVGGKEEFIQDIINGINGQSRTRTA